MHFRKYFFLDDHLQNKEFFRNAIFPHPDVHHPIDNILNEKEKTYLQLSATMASITQIAALMNVAESSLTNYQKSIKDKTGFCSRHELMSFAIQEGIAKIARFNSVPFPKY